MKKETTTTITIVQKEGRRKQQEPSYCLSMRVNETFYKKIKGIATIERKPMSEIMRTMLEAGTKYYYPVLPDEHEVISKTIV